MTKLLDKLKCHNTSRLKEKQVELQLVLQFGRCYREDGFKF